MHIFNDEYLEEIKLYWGSKIARGYEGETLWSKQSMNQHYALSNMWKLAKVCAQDKQFTLKNKMHNHGIITPTKPLKACAKINYECLKMQMI